MLPKKFRHEFGKTGIDINDPKYGKWVEKHEHRKGAYWYNQQWEEFFDQYRTEPAPINEIIKKMNSLNKDL